jgi:hypothetical protein
MEKAIVRRSSVRTAIKIPVMLTGNGGSVWTWAEQINRPEPQIQPDIGCARKGLHFANNSAIGYLQH